MKLNRICKNVVASVAAVAMVCATLVYSPSEAKAASAPIVTFLGATLSLDAAEGYQSMRVAIKVENADNASACGMTITKKRNGKAITFSTANERQDKLYDADTESNTVVYAVKIADVPVGNFNEEFDIVGFATPIEGGTEDVTSGAAETRSIDSVVTAISAQDSSIEMLDGVLVTSVNKLDISAVDSLVASGELNVFSVYSGNMGKALAEKVGDGDSAYAKVTTYNTENQEEAINVTASGAKAGLMYRSKDVFDCIIKATVRAVEGNQVQLVSSFGAYNAVGSTGTCQTLSQRLDAGSWWYYGITTNGTASTYDIKEFSIYKVLKSGELDDTKLLETSYEIDLTMASSYENIYGSTSIVPQTDRSLRITFNETYGGVKFSLPSSFNNSDNIKYVKITYLYTKGTGDIKFNVTSAVEETG